jgi:hypothetical protein
VLGDIKAKLEELQEWLARKERLLILNAAVRDVDPRLQTVREYGRLLEEADATIERLRRDLHQLLAQ